MIWFTADYHLNHRNIIKYCNRPFADVDDMDKEILNRLFYHVKRGDTLYHLGDISLKSAMTDVLLNQCQARGVSVCLVSGNHDNTTQEHRRKLGWVSTLRTITINRTPVVLCHYPMARWDRSHYGSIQLHGHCHGTFHTDARQLDVGVDNQEFCPINFDQVYALLKDKRNPNEVRREHA